MTLREKIYRTIIIFSKNLLAFLLGGTLGVIATIIFAERLLQSAITKDVGLGVIVLAPMLFTFYIILFGAGGGIIAVIIYNIVKFFRSKK